MRRQSESMNKKTLSCPYLFWAIAFIVIPLCMVIYYGLTDKTGAFTLENIMTIATAEHAKALWLSIELSIVSTIICFLLAYPLAMILTGLNVNQHSFIVVIFILPMWMNFLLRTMAWQRYQRHPAFSASAFFGNYQYAGCYHSRHGLQFSAVYGTAAL